MIVRAILVPVPETAYEEISGGNVTVVQSVRLRVSHAIVRLHDVIHHYAEC